MFGIYPSKYIHFYSLEGRDYLRAIFVSKVHCLSCLTSTTQNSKAINQPVLKADSISFNNPQIKNAGYEPKVAGAAFNKANQSKISSVIAGELGVFIIKTETVGAVPNPSMDVKAQQSAQQQMLKSFMQRGVVENIKKAANIKDERYKYF